MAKTARNREKLVTTIRCRRCHKEGPALERQPFKNELGLRIEQEICRQCWADWQQHQTLLINHYGLDPRDPEARAFLYSQVEQVLLGGGGADGSDVSA